MKDEALEIARRSADPAAALNRLREYLQALVLRSLHDSEAFLNLAFVGGTALRFIHNLRRFSEDLDFCLVRDEGYEPEDWLRLLKTRLGQGGIEANLRWNRRTVVHKAWIRVPGLLHEAGLAAMPGQNLSIRLEIDTHPPDGAVVTRSLVDRPRILALQHYDLPSLMAGKLHALLCRQYPKGRDWYDLIWYRAHEPRIEPNVVLLQNALDQTQSKGNLRATEWRRALSEKVETADIDALRRDIAPFLEVPEEWKLFDRENLLAVIRGR